MKPGDEMQTVGTQFLAPGTRVTLLAGREARYGDKWLVRVHTRSGLDARWYVKESCLAALAAARKETEELVRELETFREYKLEVDEEIGKREAAEAKLATARELADNGIREETIEQLHHTTERCLAAQLADMTKLVEEAERAEATMRRIAAKRACDAEEARDAAETKLATAERRVEAQEACLRRYRHAVGLVVSFFQRIDHDESASLDPLLERLSALRAIGVAPSKEQGK